MPFWQQGTLHLFPLQIPPSSARMGNLCFHLQQGTSLLYLKTTSLLLCATAGIWGDHKQRKHGHRHWRCNSSGLLCRFETLSIFCALNEPPDKCRHLLTQCQNIPYTCISRRFLRSDIIAQKISSLICSTHNVSEILTTQYKKLKTN